MRKSVGAARTRCAVYLEEEKKNESFKTKSGKKITDREIKRFGVRLLRKTKPVKC